MTPMTEAHLERLKRTAVNFPTCPGVYLMYDANELLLYIGKAKNIRSRVFNYLNETDNRQTVQVFMPQVNRIDFTVTETEEEALLLENTLIKSKKPKYNIMFRDGKTYPSIRIESQHPFPRITSTRRILKDGALYFGPYANHGSIAYLVEQIQNLFQLRSCSNHEFSSRKRPCLKYEMKQCLAPCVYPETQGEYLHNIELIKLFLKGKKSVLLDALEKKMLRESESLNFEQAARTRDLMASVQNLLERQHVIDTKLRDLDAISFVEDNGQRCFSLLKMREGKLLGDIHLITDANMPQEEQLEAILTQYILQQNGQRLPEIILPFLPATTEVLQDFCKNQLKQTLQLSIAKQGFKQAFLSLATRNAKNQLQSTQHNSKHQMEILHTLKHVLRLEHLPLHMECYDISNLQGKDAVASQVVFKNGIPDKSSYRRYKIKTVHQSDDFAMMAEVLQRRFKTSDTEDHPQLIVIDGGKGQLAAAQKILDSLAIKNIDLIGMAKARSIQPKWTATGIDHTRERFFKANRPIAIYLDVNSPPYYLLQRLRDEAHRFAITFHKKLRSTRSFQSTLDDIPGIGKKRKTTLLQHFQSVERLKASDPQTIAKLPGFSLGLAEKVLHFFQTQDSQ